MGRRVVRRHDDSPRVAAAVRAARQRRGWSRETLAHESGLSFGAITQIENGRRTELRVSSLVALANALGVSVDYLVRAEVAVSMLDHRAHVYDSPEQLVRLAERVARDGLDAGDAVLIVAPEPDVAAIRAALGSDAKRVSFGESSGWYTTPSQTTQRYAAFARDARNAGAHWIDILGEPVWTGRDAAETQSWTRYESLLNVVFAPWPVTVGCLYNRATVPAHLWADVERTHPAVVTRDGVKATPLDEPVDVVTRSGR
jgi:transcriptional regulator with XRE-family HTH domain